MVNDEPKMIAYLDLPNKFRLRNIAMSHLVLPYANEMKSCQFSMKETAEALTMLAGIIARRDDVGDEDGDDAGKYLDPFDDFGKLETESTEMDYGDGQKHKDIPADKRIELLARILLTVQCSLEGLAMGMVYEDDYIHERQKLRALTEKAIRKSEVMRRFVLPDINLQYVRAPRD